MLVVVFGEETRKRQASSVAVSLKVLGRCPGTAAGTWVTVSRFISYFYLKIACACIIVETKY